MNNDHIFNYIEKGKVFHINEKQSIIFYKSTIKQFLLKCLEHGMLKLFLLKILIDLPEPQSKKECDKNVSQVIKYVASRLHHTPNVSKKSYINNSILSLYKNDFKQFFKIIENISKNRVPSIDRILTEFLSYLCKN